MCDSLVPSVSPSVFFSFWLKVQKNFRPSGENTFKCFFALRAKIKQKTTEFDCFLLMEWAERAQRENFPILKCWIAFFYSEMITNSYNIVPKYTDRQVKSQVEKNTKC